MMDEQISDTSNYNAFDKLVGHENFSLVLELFHHVKELKSKLDAVAEGDALPPLHRPLSMPNHNHHPQECVVEGDAFPFDESASLIRDNLIRPGATQMKRGVCAITDSLIDETITALASELRSVLSLKKQMKAARTVGMSEDREAVHNGILAQGNKENEQQAKGEQPKKELSKVKNKSNANKFTKTQTDVLINWMIENRKHPFPSKADIASLSVATGLTHQQIDNWCTNTRKRNLKAIVENEKKPYHFLDYLFLATDREKHIQQNVDFNTEGLKLDGQTSQPELSPVRSPATPAMLRRIFRHDNIFDDSPFDVDVSRAENTSSLSMLDPHAAPFDEIAADNSASIGVFV